MTDRLSRRQILKLGAAAPVAIALSAMQVPTAVAATPPATPNMMPLPGPPTMSLPGPNMMPSRKKGVGVARLVSDAPYRVEAMNPAWYYTWAADGIPGVQNVEFVPMVWGGVNNIQTQISEVEALSPGRQRVVLGPNEPDNAAQSNMTVAEVLQYWAQITDLAALTVAPAPVHPLDAWIMEFMQQATKMNLRPNFIAVHTYPGADPEGFLSGIDQVYTTYGLPIWVTEFAVADWNASKTVANSYTAQDVLGFMEAVLPGLESRPYVARYAWFGAGPAAAASPALGPSALFDTSGAITALGEYYAQFGVAPVPAPPGPSPVPAPLGPPPVPAPPGPSPVPAPLGPPPVPAPPAMSS